MCGIVGFIGKKPAAPLLLEGLSKLEYRGYDSAGIALLDGQGLTVNKSKGRLQILSDKMNGGDGFAQAVGIGHTRWATHGKPSDRNSHPHVSQNGKFAVVHNGIIENYLPLKAELTAKGVTFASETDTEVVAQLLEQNYHGDFHQAVVDTVSQIEGSYALGILCEDYPDVLYTVRNASPLIIGLSDEGNFIASDVPAILTHTRRIVRLNDHEMARLGVDSITVWDKDGNETEKPVETVNWDVSAAEKGGYAHFMLKEIKEQPGALEATLSPRINEQGMVALDGINFSKEQLENLQRIVIVACGSAYHAGVAGKYFLEKMVGIPVETDLASEFRYREPLVNEKTLTIIISQSGETADTLAALREAKKRGSRVLSIVNVVGSTIALESDDVLYTWAGPEIAVATTKGYTTQVSMLYLVGLTMAEKMGRITADEQKEYVKELQSVSALVEKSFEIEPELQELAKKFTKLEHGYFIGRNVDYAVALEASLKLKEISYIHSEAYAAGELKHGTISLIEDGTIVIALACRDELVEKTMSNIKEVKARGAYVIVFTDKEHQNGFREADVTVAIPDAPALFKAVPEIVPLQLLSYYIALYRGCDIDKPRNLAKSVTVE